MNGAVRLFEEIDINGDGEVEWNEFVQYVTDQCTTEIHRRPTEGAGASDPLYLVDNLKKEKLRVFKKFHLCERLIDGGKHRC